jgi:competence protein ComEC
LSASRNAALAVLAITALAAGWICGTRPDESVRLSFLAVGQGDCAVLQQGNSAIMIDAGPTESSAKFTILPALRHLGVTRLDAILLSHPDEDHVAGTAVIRRRFPAARVAISAGFREHPDLLRKLSEWRMGADEVEWLPERQAQRVGSFDLDIYCPPVTAGTPDNDGSMVVRMSDGNATAVFTGDGSAEEEALVAAQGDWSAEIMHAGHHGSNSSTSFTWLGEVNPEYVVISCGQFNRFGHPGKRTLARLAETRAKVLRTDRDGTITFILREGRFEPE